MFKNKIFLAFLALIIIFIMYYSFNSNNGSNSEFDQKIEAYKTNLVNMSDSPVSDLNGFDFFEDNPKLKLEGDIVKIEKEQSLTMTDSTSLSAKLFGQVKLNIDNSTISLLIFDEGDHYMLPFKDLTNQDLTYGGGRYLNISKSNQNNGKIEIDFNDARNFYCAYSPNFVCPIPPKENTITLKIEAGEKRFKLHP